MKELETAILNLADAAKKFDEAMNKVYSFKKANIKGFSSTPSLTAQRFVHQDVANIIQLNRFEDCQLRAIHAVSGKWQPTTKPQLPNLVTK